MLDTPGEPLRWYVMTGPDLPDLRQDYMELVGRPPVPPRQMFGMWVSEYGYDDWGELLGVLKSLEDAHFPVDGFVLDLEWYGGIGAKGYMGALAWDLTNFPDPEGFIARLREDHGASLMVMEESYVNQTLPDYDALHQQGILVTKCETGCDPITLVEWWGVGSMVDWTNPAAADAWHDLRRQHLIDEGVIAHWIDLGEPDNYDPRAWYYGFPDQNLHGEADVHNIYNLLWAESIARGYARHDVARRPFMLSRSGTSGIQRYGTAMWSGDIGSNLDSLAAHFGAQLHMSLSGIDYYGADIGGFMRNGIDPGADMNEMYTIWFANGIVLDIPGRPHTYNLANVFPTAPSLIGDLDSNLANIRQRYAFSPYLYSLAHRAYLYGEAVEPPLVYYYQDDPNVRGLAGEKMIGRDVLFVTVSEYRQTATDVYLPAGRWIEYHSGLEYDSSGEWIKDVPLYYDDKLQLPLFLRGGAIIPQMYVDDQTANVLGQRRDGSTRDELIVTVMPNHEPSQFTLYEDDGETVAYQDGAVRTTTITQAFSDLGGTTVTIEAADGTYANAPAARDNVVILMSGGAEYVEVKFNGEDLPRLTSQAEFESAERGWYVNGDLTRVYAKSGPADVSSARQFDFLLARG
jgi:alpha-glucosidase